jgi:hypothetical protein
MGIWDGWISLVHSLWSTQIVHLLHRLSTSYPIVIELDCLYLLVNIDNSFPLEPLDNRTAFRFSLPRLSTDRA